MDFSPRQIMENPNLDRRSDLMKAKDKSINRKVNACPFGCSWQHLDQNCYCRHLVGFSNDGKTYEPMVRNDRGQRVVRVRMKVVEEISEYDDDGNPVKIEIKQPVPDPVQKGDVLVRITSSYRVYRDVDKKGINPSPRAESDQTPENEEDVDRLLRQTVADMSKTKLTTMVPNKQEDFAVVQ